MFYFADVYVAALLYQIWKVTALLSQLVHTQADLTLSYYDLCYHWFVSCGSD